MESAGNDWRGGGCFFKSCPVVEGHIDCRWALVQLYMELPGIVGGSERKARLYAQELMNLSKIDGLLAFGLIEVYKNDIKRLRNIM